MEEKFTETVYSPATQQDSAILPVKDTVAGTSTVPVAVWKLLKSTCTETASPVKRVTCASGPTTVTSKEVVVTSGFPDAGGLITWILEELVVTVASA